MSRRVALVAVLLYPLAFRRRYGDEMRELISETPVRAATVLGLLRGALYAHVSPPAGLVGQVGPLERLRMSTSGVLACWVVFAAAGFGFYKTTEDVPFRVGGRAHPLLAGAHVAVQGVAVVASLALLAGALPLVALAINHARHRRGVLRLLRLPLSAVALFAGFTALLVVLAHGDHSHGPTTASRVAFISWEAAALASAAACVLASRRALLAMPVARKWLAAAFAFAALVTVAMIAMALATALYTIVFRLDAAGLGATTNGPLGLVSVNVSLVEQCVVMVVAAALASVSTLRGWREGWSVGPAVRT